MVGCCAQPGVLISRMEKPKKKVFGSSSDGGTTTTATEGKKGGYNKKKVQLYAGASIGAVE